LTTAIAKVEPASLEVVSRRNTAPMARLSLPTTAEIQALTQYAQIVMKSGIAPGHFKNPEAVLVVMRYGHQLGIDEFTALQNMFVIGGKPTMMASLMHGLILRDHGPNAIHIKQQDEKACVLSCRPKGADTATEIGFTMQEAVNAGLTTKNQNWKTYPSDMLFSRAVSRAARRVFRDTTLGMYTPEELDANMVEVDGEIIGTVSIVETTPEVSQNALESTETNETVLVLSFDERINEALDETDKTKRRDAFRALYKEALADKSVRKIELLVKAMPEGDYVKAEAMMTDAFERHQLYDPSWNVALKARVDAPAEFVDVASGEIVE
jgi:hypothetical protein